MGAGMGKTTTTEKNVHHQRTIADPQTRVGVPAPLLPVSLNSLPGDVLSHIVTNIDSQTALVFARVAPGFAAAADEKIWEKLDLDIYSEHAMSSPPDQPEEARWGRRTSMEDVAAKSQRRFDLQRLEDEGRWGYVRVLRLRPQSGVRGMTDILERVWTKLAVLAIGRPDGQPLPDPENNALTTWLARPKTVFTSLTSLRLGPGAISSLDLIPLCCKVMPGLISLDIAVPEIPEARRNPTTRAKRAEYEINTRVQRIRLSYDHWQSHSSDDTSFDAIITLLARSPQISQMIFAYPGWLPKLPKAFIAAVAMLPQLQDLYWQSIVWEGGWGAENVFKRAGVSGCFPELRRLMIHCGSHDGGVSKSTPHAPKLEILLYDWKPRPRTYYPGIDAMENEGVNMRLVNMLESHPRLHTVQYYAPGLGSHTDGFEFFPTMDTIEGNSRSTGRIHSYHCGESTNLLHVEIQSRSVSGYGQNTNFIFRWERALDASRDLNPEGSPNQDARPRKSSRTSYTCYRGVTVPLDIIERMRVVQKATHEEWADRGVEVGEEAWKVVSDWYDVAESERLQVLKQMANNDLSSSEDSSEDVGKRQGGWKWAAYARIARQHARKKAKEAMLLSKIRRERSAIEI